MAKRYYWLKLKEDFFKQREIKKLRKIAGGDTYTIIYQKLLLLSLQDEGKIYFDGIEDDFFQEMALELDEMEDNVKMTILYLQKHNLIEQVEENEYFLTKITECIGSESESAERVRRLRVRNKTLGKKNIDEKRYGGNGLKVLERDNYLCAECGSKDNICIHHKNGLSNNMEDLITLCRKCHSTVTCNSLNVTCNGEVTKCNIEKEIEKELEIELEDTIVIPTTRITTPYQQIAELFNEICEELPSIVKLTDARKRKIKSIYIKNDQNIIFFKELFQKVKESDFLNGRNNTKWMCSFDWMLNETNLTKILEDNYKNKDVFNNNGGIDW